MTFGDKLHKALRKLSKFIEPDEDASDDDIVKRKKLNIKI